MKGRLKSTYREREGHSIKTRRRESIQDKSFVTYNDDDRKKKTKTKLDDEMSAEEEAETNRNNSSSSDVTCGGREEAVKKTKMPNHINEPSK